MLNEFVLLILLVVVASLLSVSVEWHIAVACLWLVYVVAGTWLLVVATPELAIAKFVTGTTVCALLLPGVRSLSAGNARQSGRVRRLVDAAGSTGADEPFMLVGAVLVAASAIALSYAFPIVEGASNFAWYWLGLLGVLLVMLARDLVRTGIGLMLLLNAVDLLDTMVARNQGVGAIGARSVVTIVLALAMATLWSVLASTRITRPGTGRTLDRPTSVSLAAEALVRTGATSPRAPLRAGRTDSALVGTNTPFLARVAGDAYADNEVGGDRARDSEPDH